MVYVLGATGQIVFATAILAPLSYVAAATNLPMQDANLQVVDQALGLDWLGYVKFVNDRPLLAGWLQVGYTMIGWPIFFTPVVLAAAGHYLRLQIVVVAFTAALAATVLSRRWSRRSACSITSACGHGLCQHRSRRLFGAIARPSVGARRLAAPT